MALPTFLAGWPRITLRYQLLSTFAGSMLVAFVIAAAMSVLLPPGRDAAIRVDRIAVALRGNEDDRLVRTIVAAPPGQGSDRWLEVAGARRQLAAVLRVPIEDVRFVVAAPLRASRADKAAGDRAVRAGFILLAQEVTAAPPTATIPAPGPPLPAAATVALPPVSSSLTASEPPTRGRQRAQEQARQRKLAAARIRVQATVTAPAPTPAPVARVAPPPPVVLPPAPAPVALPVKASPRRLIPPTIGAMLEVQSAFEAALRLRTGGWAIVREKPETMPTATQQHILVWFLVALALTLPVLWLILERMMRPIEQFANAVEATARDPSEAVSPDRVPADLSAAVAALAKLRARTLGLMADREALSGTVRTELQVPVTQLRAALDEAPRQVREAFHDFVMEIEQGVTALDFFLTDAAAPGQTSRLNLRDLLEQAAASAGTRGEVVVVAGAATALVDVDAEAVTRLAEQLISYVAKGSRAVSAIIDTDAETALVLFADAGQKPSAGFAPGLRGKAERAGGTRGAGPGLAVARSIARSHGGSVRLVRAAGGMRVEFRIPLA